MDNPLATFSDLPPSYPSETKQSGNFDDIPPYAADPNYFPPPYYQPLNPMPYQAPVVPGSNNNGFVYNGGSAPPQPQQQTQLDFTGAFVLAGVVYCCCCCIFGAIAFIIAMIGQNNSPRNRANAEQLMRASYGVSIAGIVVGVILSVALAVFYYYFYFIYVDRLFSTTTKYPLFFRP